MTNSKTIASRIRPALLASVAAVATLTACKFGSYEPSVPQLRLHYAADGAAAVSHDGAHLFATDLLDAGGMSDKRLRVFDISTGLEEGNIALSGSWGAVAMAEDTTDVDQAWVLHANGYQLLWRSDLAGIDDWEAPIPGNFDPGFSSRMYCDMDRSNEGVTYVTTIDYADGAPEAWLYRHTPGAGWDRTQDLDNGDVLYKCSRVSFDEYHDLAVLLHEDELYVFDDMVFDGGVDLPPTAGGPYYSDLASFGGWATVGSVGTEPSGNGALRSVSIFDGTVDDLTELNRVHAVTLDFDEDGAGQVEDAHVWFTGFDSYPIKYAAGRFHLEY